MPEVIIADASCFIVLEQIDALHLLHDVHDTFPDESTPRL
jgi:hypothetical protein